MNTSLKTTMQNFAVNQALKYLEGNPAENIPKLMALVDKFTPADWYGSQRAAIRNVIEEKNNWYQLILKIYDLDPGVRQAFFQNFLMNASLKGRLQCAVGDPSGLHLRLQYALHRLLGGGIRQPPELKP